MHSSLVVRPSHNMLDVTMHMKAKLELDHCWTEQKLEIESTWPTKGCSCVNKRRTSPEHFLFYLSVCETLERQLMTTDLDIQARMHCIV